MVDVVVVQALCMAEQKYSALQEKLIAVKAEYESSSLDHERQKQDWQARHVQQLNNINRLQSELSHDRQQFQHNRLVSYNSFNTTG